MFDLKRPNSWEGVFVGESATHLSQGSGDSASHTFFGDLLHTLMQYDAQHPNFA